ncbi:hypothetical protein FRC01_008125, partial [Tulasnella sp. 417]
MYAAVSPSVRRKTHTIAEKTVTANDSAANLAKVSVLSRQLSATAEDSNSTDYDPAPVPPPESQKKQMTGGRSNKYYYTDAENDFIAKYLA